MPSIRPVQVVVISAPCPPWSRAAGAPVLRHPDGQLLLRAADICGIAEIPVVVLEQVENFPRHSDYRAVCRAWSLSGYEVRWQQTLDAQDVLPAARKRHIMVLRHRSCPPGYALPVVDWSMQRKPTLHSSQVLLELPPAVEAALVPAPPVWNVYLDPWYLPHSVATANSACAPLQYRVREKHQSTGCFPAQYGHQHELSPDLLERKGLLGQFLKTGSQIRFFAGAEIALMLGAVRPILLEQDTRTQNRALGNAISVPHAAIGLLFAAATLRVGQLPSPEEVMSCFQKHRMRSGNVLFVPSGPDWVLCPRSDLPALLDRLQARPVAQQADLGGFFVMVTLQGPNDSFTLQVASSIASQGQEGLTLWLTASGPYVLDGHSPLFWPQVVRVVEDLAITEGHQLALCMLSGHRLPKWDPQLPCCVAVAESLDQEMFPLSFWAKVRPQLKVEGQTQVCVQTTGEDQTIAAWLGMPFHVLHAAGWQTQVRGYPPVGNDNAQFVHSPRPDVLQLRVGDVCVLRRLWLITAQLDQIQQEAGQQVPKVEVHFQVVTQTVWQGCLPPTVTLQHLEDLWFAASEACALPPLVRVFSGPFPCPVHLTIADVQGLQRCYRRNGVLVLTFHPSVQGGGVTVENGEWTSARVASLCLGRGCPLAAPLPSLNNSLPR